MISVTRKSTVSGVSPIVMTGREGVAVGELQLQPALLECVGDDLPVGPGPGQGDSTILVGSCMSSAGERSAISTPTTPRPGTSSGTAPGRRWPAAMAWPSSSSPRSASRSRVRSMLAKIAARRAGGVQALERRLQPFEVDAFALGQHHGRLGESGDLLVDAGHQDVRAGTRWRAAAGRDGNPDGRPRRRRRPAGCRGRGPIRRARPHRTRPPT